MTQVIDYMEAGVGIEPASTALQAASEIKDKRDLRLGFWDNESPTFGWFPGLSTTGYTQLPTPGLTDSVE